MGLYRDIYHGMSDRAKVFTNGRSQAVRLPLAYRFPEDVTEVSVRREGRRVILEPVDEWPEGYFEGLGVYPEPIERPAVECVRDPFAGCDEGELA